MLTPSRAFAVAVSLAVFGCTEPADVVAQGDAELGEKAPQAGAPEGADGAGAEAAPGEGARGEKAAATASPTVYVEVDDGGLALRAQPSVDASMLLVIPDGAHLLVGGTAIADYTPVSYFGVSGWVHTSFLDTKDRGGIVLDAPTIAQNPELQRGCEVTSLAMLFGYLGKPVDKLALASEVEKVPFYAGGNLRGNPNDGFVGDIYTFAQPGYGVYHAPVARLAEKHAPAHVDDITGGPVESVFARLDQQQPVVVIVNALFHELGASEFQTWHTSSGDIRITMQEHSVLVVGYDSQHVFVNDPLDPETKAKPLPREPFRAAWEQMGRQAIAIRP